MTHPEFLNSLIKCLDAPLLNIRTLAIDFLLFTTSLGYPEGHQLVMAAFRHLKSQRKEERLFQTFVTSIDDVVRSRGTWGALVGSKVENITNLALNMRNKTTLHREMKEFLVSAISLVRYLIEIPVEVEYRIHIRGQFAACGLFDTIEVKTMIIML